MDTNQELPAIISSRREAIVNDTILATTILLGYEGEDYFLPEADSNWWRLYLWVKRN